MNPSNKTYSWKTYVSFINKETRHLSKSESHPVVDSIAQDLMTGALQRRDRQGRPSEAARTPTELRRSYLIPDEVNARPAMSKWRLRWEPAQTLPTPKQEVKLLGWKGALQNEGRRIRARNKSAGGHISNVQLSKELCKYAVTHGIRTDSQIYPSANYIRNHVIRSM